MSKFWLSQSQSLFLHLLQWFLSHHLPRKHRLQFWRVKILQISSLLEQMFEKLKLLNLNLHLLKKTLWSCLTCSRRMRDPEINDLVLFWELPSQRKSSRNDNYTKKLWPSSRTFCFRLALKVMKRKNLTSLFDSVSKRRWLPASKRFTNSKQNSKIHPTS
jgi:hypothetical protein